jgi:hypothetical protein
MSHSATHERVPDSSGARAVKRSSVQRVRKYVRYGESILPPCRRGFAGPVAVAAGTRGFSSSRSCGLLVIGKDPMRYGYTSALSISIHGRGASERIRRRPRSSGLLLVLASLRGTVPSGNRTLQQMRLFATERVGKLRAGSADAPVEPPAASMTSRGTGFSTRAIGMMSCPMSVVQPIGNQ